MNTLAERLKTTLKEQKVSQSALAKWLGVKPQQIQAVCSGKILRPTNIVEMAQYLNVSPFWLQTGKGPKDLKQNAVMMAEIQRLPIIPWDKVEQIDYDQLKGDVDIQWIYSPRAASNKSYALMVHGHSMIGQDISFPPGYLIIVDPEKPPTDNCYVIVTINGKPSFRHYTVEGGQCYLRLLNTNYPNPTIEANANNQVLGVVCGTYRDLN